MDSKNVQQRIYEHTPLVLHPFTRINDLKDVKPRMDWSVRTATQRSRGTTAND